MAGLVAGCGALVLVFFTLDLLGRLPAPQFTNELCKDEKLAFLRERAPTRPDLIAIGSSVAVFNFAGAAIYERSGGAEMPLNAGMCRISMNEIGYLGRYLLSRYASASDLVLLVSPNEFESCAAPDQVFDARDVDRYVFEKWPKYLYYAKYFSAMSFLRRVRAVETPAAPMRVAAATLAFDRFGSFLSEKERDLFYGSFSLDPQCFTALHRFLADVGDRLRNTVVVISPLHPDWVHRYDPDGALMGAFTDAVAAAVTHSRAVLWDAHAELRLPAQSFSDAIHMKKEGAEQFSRELAARMAEAAKSGSAASHELGTPAPCPPCSPAPPG